MGRLGFNSAPKAPQQQQQDAEVALGIEKPSGNAKSSDSILMIYANEEASKKMKAMRLLVLALVVVCIFMSAFVALPQLTRLCQSDSNSELNNEVATNITKVIESDQECSDKINNLLSKLEEANNIKTQLESTLEEQGSIKVAMVEELERLTEENRRLSALQPQPRPDFTLRDNDSDEDDNMGNPSFSKADDNLNEFSIINLDDKLASLPSADDTIF